MPLCSTFWKNGVARTVNKLTTVIRADNHQYHARPQRSHRLLESQRSSYPEYQQAGLLVIQLGGLHGGVLEPSDCHRRL